MLGLRDRQFRCHGNNRVEAAAGLPERQVAPAIGLPRLDQPNIAVDRAFQHVIPSVKMTQFLALGQNRADRGRGVERRHPGASRADAFGQRALRHQFQLDLAGGIKRLEADAGRAARPGYDQLAHPPQFDQPRHAFAEAADRIADDSQVARAVLDQTIQQDMRLADGGKPGNQDGGTVLNAVHRLRDGPDALINHLIPGAFAALSFVPLSASWRRNAEGAQRSPYC